MKGSVARGMRCVIVLAVALLPIAACSSAPAMTPSHKEMRSVSWQEQIREPDRKRLAGLWSAWTRALNQAAAAGHTAEIKALGPLAVADAAQPGPLPAPGAYRCRSIRLGTRDDNSKPALVPAMDADAPIACTITAKGDLLVMAQATDGMRIGGTLYPDGDRMIFLGSKALKGEMGIRAYGADAARDQVGVLRSFGDRKWRLELPWPMWQSNLEIIEIVPG